MSSNGFVTENIFLAAGLLYAYGQESLTKIEFEDEVVPHRYGE